MNAMKSNGTPSIKVRNRKLRHMVYCVTRERTPRWSLVGGFADELSAILYAESLVPKGWFVASVHPKGWYSYRSGTRVIRGTTIRKPCIKKLYWTTKFPNV